MTAAAENPSADLRPPFATGAQRLRLLYQLPLTGQEARILVIGSRLQAEAAFGGPLRHMRIEIAEPGAPIQSSGFDAVALPGSLLRSETDVGQQAANVVPEHLLQMAFLALRPGGIVVGHLDHLMSAHALRALAQGHATLDTWLRCRSMRSGPRCQETLSRLGFAEAECFFVEPKIEAPMAVVSVHPLAAKSHFLRAIRRTRGQYSAFGYFVRMTLARLRLGGTLQPHLFFWAKRPC